MSARTVEKAVTDSTRPTSKVLEARKRRKESPPAIANSYSPSTKRQRQSNVLESSDSELSYHTDISDSDSDSEDGGQNQGETTEKDKRAQTTSVGTNPKPMRKPRSKRGKYKPRRAKGWESYFKSRQPTVSQDGCVVVDHKLEDTRTIPTAHRWCRILRKNTRSTSVQAQSSLKPIRKDSRRKAGEGEGLDEDDDSDDDNDNYGEDEDDDEEVYDSSDYSEFDEDNEEVDKNRRKHDGEQEIDRAFIGNKINKGSLLPKAKEALDNELKSGVWPDWLLDPPPMQYPYLQHAFPYDKYTPPRNRVSTSWQDPQTPLSADWYGLQGTIHAEDIFSREKLDYAAKVIKNIDVERASLRMEMYYHRGFELASRRLLDRVRQKNLVQEKPKVPDGLQTYSMRPTGLTNESQQHEQSFTESSPQPIETEPPSAATARPPTLLPLSQRNGGDTPDTTISSTPSTVNPGESETSANVAETINTSDEPERMRADTQPKLEDYYQVNTFLSSLFQQGSGEGSDLPVPLSPAGCRILQTMLTGLENKVMRMGCHSQRMELTRRLGQIELYSAVADAAKKAAAKQAGKSQMQQEQQELLTGSVMEDAESVALPPLSAKNSKRRYFKRIFNRQDMDDYVVKVSRMLYKVDRQKTVSDQQGLSGLLSSSASNQMLGPTSMNESVSTETGPENTLSRAESTANDSEDVETSEIGGLFTTKPFVSNPLKIPTTMDPFYQAREALVKQMEILAEDNESIIDSDGLDLS
ncbi:hypothetical protein BCR41DRAFT_426906 [Lobosporangium transversale]|uniref:Uncharacterized protein n=1 Tax=Lobosporangium transversale TaxID=64571 RepID=A0A1Y2G9B9_9FUNG|nr:hypothetical protein BCR41DRAFT_426906 [Lobosporangium transversale]ORY95096.1 hypothetical protein BCR41DRAFT_426906 [Lobosporangium transversale]|eukprot:XP_021875305.1 hypothetical protein BCR41DRAFT_426906 [Lobosporangium transversale]